MDWHCKTTDEVFIGLESSPEGLTSEEAQKRLLKYGHNELAAQKKKSLFMMVVGQFTDLFIIILLIAAVIAGFVGDPAEAGAILAIVILNAIIGVIQEYRAERAIEALRSMAAPAASVIRDGQPTTIPSSQLVPGDVVALDAGKIVPADLRLVEVAQMKAEEAALTGESVPVEKQVRPLPDPKLLPGDRKNMGFSGTFVTYGRGKGIVVATGMQTELGRIAHMLKEEEDKRTPMQRRLQVFSKKLTVAIFIIVIIIFAVGMLRGEQLVLMFLTAVSLAVAAIPEALPAVVTISLALGARRMVQQNVLIRNLPAVETLGSVSYICTDKTGTLTKNKMIVEKIYCGGEDGSQQQPSREMLLTGMAVSNDAFLEKSGKVSGDPTEVAMYVFSREAGFHKEELIKEFPRVGEVPFDSDRKLMTTFHRWKNGRFISFTKGAVEAVLDRSISSMAGDFSEIRNVNTDMANNGLRVLAIAMHEWNEMRQAITAESVEKDLSFVGLVGMIDPIREEAVSAVSLCKTAGIRPVMITGDHPITARAIGSRLGIIEAKESVLTGRELEELDAKDLSQDVEQIAVYARVDPAQKLKIVKALQERSHFVAMTGDGVNDAPALKAANIGVAMGTIGTDVAKQASHMILLDDNFATMVQAVKEGRRIYDNILKFITYSLTCNTATIVVIFLAPFFGMPLTLLPIQILWMNLLCDSLPGLALTAEAADTAVMRRPPRPYEEGIFDRGRGPFIVAVGVLMGIAMLVFQWLTEKYGLPWQTMVFTGLVMGRMAIAMACRSDHDSVIRMGIFSNSLLCDAILLTFALQIAVVYIPHLNPIFHTKPLTGTELGITLIFSVLALVVLEVAKFFRRRV